MQGNSENALANKIASSMLWRLMERGGMQVVQFVIQIVLARLLSPDDYGLLAIIMVFISFSTTLINNGLGNAIIQKQEATELDFNTVFYIQLVIAAICYVAIYFAAPYIAIYYEDTALTKYLRVMAIILFLEALASIQLTSLRKNMLFKKSFWINLTGTIVQGISGIIFAVCGFGVWSLILSQILMKASVCVALLLMVKWKPARMFSTRCFLSLFSYSWKLSVAWMIGTLHQQLYSLVIGKCFSVETLGYYSKGQSLPNVMTTTVNETIPSVMFPALATIQNDEQEFKKYTRLMMRLTAFALCPMMAGVAAISKNFVCVMLTEKWLPSVGMMQLFCVSFGINVLSTTNMQAFNAKGRSDIFMKLEIIKRSLSLVLLIIAAQFSIYMVIMVLALMGVFSLVYNTFPNRKLLGYTIREQLEDIVPSLILSLIMFCCVILLNKIQANQMMLLVLQIIVGVAVYGGLSLLFNRDCIEKALALFKNLRK